MENSPNKPVAIVTGASRGIGHATCDLLSRRGYRLAMVSRTPPRQSLPTAIHFPVDVTVPDELRGVVDQTCKAWGRIDAVVNNAGAAIMLDVDRTTPRVFADQLSVNLHSAYALVHYAWPHLRQSQGVIVNVSSMAARDPLDGFHAYAAAKAGLNMLTLTLAREGRPHGIRAMAVAPGAVETQALRAIASTDVFPAELALDPADVARVIVDCIDGPLKFSSGEVVWMKK